MTKSEAGKLGWKKSKDKRARRYQKMRENYYSAPKKCKQCNTLLKYKDRKKIFCNSSCSATYNNLQRGRRFNKCQNCGKSITGARFCNNKCHQNFLFNNAVLKLLNGDSTVSVYTVKRYLILQDNRCSVCGIAEWNNKSITFDMDHIDGNSDNNSLVNVRLLCPNCHSQTSTYKGKNVGKGRHKRRERYKAGKSF